MKHKTFLLLLLFLFIINLSCTLSDSKKKSQSKSSSQQFIKGAIAQQTRFPKCSSLSKDQIDKIKDSMIRQSHLSYPGNCPCPYHLASNGSQCGRRSAYSRPGGYSPLCYKRDITQNEAIRWAKNNQRCL